MPYCDPHGWGWEPGQGPSPCVSETLSFFLAVGIFVSSILSKDSMHPVQRAAAAGSPAAKVHTAQITLSIAQAVIALTGGFLSVRPRGVLCGALVLHSLGWTFAWLASAAAMQRNPAHCKRLFWWWLVGAVLNSAVLSGLHRASERRGHHLPAEIGCLSWLSFFGNAMLVVLQLGKPELDDVESVYVRVVGREGVVPPNTGWQAFWAGGDAWSGIDDGGNADHHSGRRGGCGSYCCPAAASRWFGRWCCFGWLRGEGGDGGGRGDDGTLEGGGGAWPIAAGQPGTTDTLNESLLGAVGFDESYGRGVSASPQSKAKRRGSRVSSWPYRGGGEQRGGYLRRMGHALSSVVGRGSKVAGEEWRQEVGQENGWRGGGGGGGGGGAGLLQQDSYERDVRGASPLGVTAGTSPRPRQVRAQAQSSSSYSGGASCVARPPPQAAAPVFGVAVTRWRLVDADGVPSSYGSSSDTVWTDRSTDRSVERSVGRSADRSVERSVNGSSSRTAALSESVVAPEGQSSSSASSATLLGDSGLPATGNGDGELGPRVAPLGVQFELAVRASGRGEKDWWGRGGAEPGAVAPGQTAGPSVSLGGSVATAAGDWRVWRSSADALALYDALALRFGQEFCTRVPRPQFKTATALTSAAGRSGGDEAASPPLEGSAPPAAPHRVDILRDARTMGAFLRSLLGLRQFLSTAVMDFLAQPPPAARASPDPMIATSEKDAIDRNEPAHGNADRQSWEGSDGCSISDDSEDERGGGRGHGDGGRGSFAAGRGADVVDPSAAGEAVAVAALATDYGQWLKRLAVKLRRATPAGQRLIRLRAIGPAVTGEQVVSWLVTSSGECRGDRASAVRLGQDMVSHRLLKPLCAGYDRPESPGAGRGGGGGGGGGWGNGVGNTDGKTDSKTDRKTDRKSGGKIGGGEQRSLFRSFDDAVGWLFAYEGDALRDPFAPPPPTQIAVMTGTCLDVRVTDWIETSDDEGAHVSFVVRTQVEATQEAWDVPRRYREFTQLRKRLLRLGIHIPTAGARGEDGGGGGGGGGGAGGSGGLGPDLPKKTWRSNKFDEGHLLARRVALEVYLQAAVEAALKTPHLAGPLVMRFLDPDESNLCLLCERNPFASRPRGKRGTTGRGGGSGDGGGGGKEGRGEGGGLEGGGGEGSKEDKAEAEDFDTLTDSLGGFL